MNHIQLLDCTLRDGGHITNSYFGQDVIKAIIDNLVKSKIDIVEVGFLQNCEYDINRAMFNSIAEVKNILPPKTESTRFALMGQADLYDFDKLEDCDGTIDVVRVSFHDYDIDEGFEAVKKVIEKGYQCFINPINIMGYSDEQLLGFIERVNKLIPYGFTMVDTFGAMKKQDLMRIYHIIDHNMDSRVKIALHLHENQSLSFSLAQNFIDINSPSRDICIDGSLYGMGRVPGNLCIELILKYMNDTMGTSYDIEPVYDAIDEYIMDLKRKNPWGYSIAYALSAQHQVHRTYAEYLMSQGRLKTKQINQILSQISEDHKTRFDEKYIEKLYAAYQNHVVDDENVRVQLKKRIGDNQVLIIAPGPSINENADRILQFVNEKKPTVISANFVWDKLSSDFAFFSNVRRFEAFSSKAEKSGVIITSNLIEEGVKAEYIMNYSDYAFYKDQISDNNMLMLIRILIRLGVRKIAFAGFDGFKEGKKFAISGMERDADYSKTNDSISQALSSFVGEVDFEFITPSMYDDKLCKP